MAVAALGVAMSSAACNCTTFGLRGRLSTPTSGLRNAEVGDLSRNRQRPVHGDQTWDAC